MVHYIQLVAYQDDGQSTEEEEESVISCHTNVVESEVETGIGVQVTEVYRTEAYRTEAVLDMVQATATGTDGCWGQQAGVHTVPETEAWDYQKAWSAQMTLSLVSLNGRLLPLAGNLERSRPFLFPLRPFDLLFGRDWRSF